MLSLSVLSCFFIFCQSPDGTLACFTDKHGRVFLFDVQTSTLLRKWQGMCYVTFMSASRFADVLSGSAVYRNARVCWARSEPSELESSCGERAVVLLIYAPRRGVLEVWNVPFGVRIAALNLGVGTLLFPSNHVADKVSPCQHCRIMRPDGTLFDLVIPYGSALSYVLGHPCWKLRHFSACRTSASQAMRDAHGLQAILAAVKQRTLADVGGQAVVPVTCVIGDAFRACELLRDLSAPSALFSVRVPNSIFNDPITVVGGPCHLWGRMCPRRACPRYPRCPGARL